MNCANCGYASVVRSNYRLSKKGTAYCKSVLRPECEIARLKEDGNEGQVTPDKD